MSTISVLFTISFIFGCTPGLKNDYKDLTEKIDHNLQLLHAPKLVSKSSAPMDSGGLSSILTFPFSLKYCVLFVYIYVCALVLFNHVASGCGNS